MNFVEKATQLIDGANIAIFNQWPVEVAFLVAMLIAATILLGLIVAPIAGFSTFIERRVAAKIQSRIGCNRVGPEGLLQFLADGLKLLMKEDLMPLGADRILFKLAPYLMVLGAFASFVCIPFGDWLVVADLNIGILFLIAMSSFAVLGTLLAGWASNNKWSVLGAMRSAAQVVSYEIPLGIALMVPIMLAGSLSLQDINLAQSGGVSRWMIFTAFPGPFLAFFVYFIAALAEVNRTPFDLPEAESELVSGYNTEYSGIRWGLFFVAEYANMFLVGAIAATVFFGGWQPTRAHLPIMMVLCFFVWMLVIKVAVYIGSTLKLCLTHRQTLLTALSSQRPMALSKRLVYLLLALSGVSTLLLQPFFQTSWFNAVALVGKAYFFVFIMMWIRWTLPRYRIDQLMDLCWKKLVPISLVCLFWTAAFMLITGKAKL